jgi:hypothetical protein
MAPADPGGGGGLPPTLPTAREELVVHRDKLHDIARALQRDLDNLKDAGTRGSLWSLQNGGRGQVTAAELGHYPAGEQIAQTCSNAYDHIGSTYQAFLDSYQDVITAIRQSVDHYDRAEDATRDSANRRGGGSESASGAPSAG